jgi:hypothetical protein
MGVPPSLAEAVAQKLAFVEGALVKDSVTNQILAHLQPTQLLSKGLMQVLDGVSSPLNLMSSLGQNYQLWKVRQMLDMLQLVSSIGAAASVLNLGVSVGGFALVLQAIRRVDEKMDRALASLDALHSMHRGDHRADVRSILEAAEDTFKLAPQDRQGRWLDTEDRARVYVNRSLERLSALGLPLESGAEIDANRRTALALPLLQQPGSDAAALLAMLMNLTNVRVEALLCRQRPEAAAELVRQQAGWLNRLPTDVDSTSRALLGGEVPPRRQLERSVQQAHALTTWVRQSHAAATQRSELCEALHRRGVDTLTYVQTVRDHPKPALLLLPHDEAAFAGMTAAISA